MRRTVPVVALTAGTLALLSRFHTSPPSLVGAGQHPGSVETPSPATESVPDTTVTAPTTDRPPAPSSTSRSSAAGRRRAATTTGPTATTTVPPGPSPTTRPASSATRTIDGPVISTRYGDVQVEITVKGRQLIDVQALQLPSDRSRSVRISAQAGPLLRSEALRAQSANIQMVSGASYTSDGYLQSLQGALDQANR